MSKLPPITARPHVFYVRPAPGWLEVVHDEVTAILRTPFQKYKYEPKITLLKSTVKVHRCDWRQGLELMLRLTTAHDIEWLLIESNSDKWEDVDAILARAPWDELLAERGGEVHVAADTIDTFTSSSAKLRENLCRIADVKHVSEGADVRIKMEQRTGLLKIRVSLAGEPLYKRGYKASLVAVAPLAEHHAAACVRWALAGAGESPNVGTVFVPFAGSGTLGFEALVVLAGAGPGSFSRRFACDAFPGTPQPTMAFLRRKLAERLQSAQLPKVIFNDHHPDAVGALRENAAAFGKIDCEILEGDFFAIEPGFAPTGKILVLLNPPFGDRLAMRSEIPNLYARSARKLNDLAAAHPGRIVGACLCPDDLTWRRFLQTLKCQSSDTRHFTHGGKDMRVVRWTA